LIISEMQCKLATWSTENKERKFDRLLRLIADRTWLKPKPHASRWPPKERVRRASMVLTRHDEANLQHELTTIRDELLAGSYKPAARAARVHPESERQAEATSVSRACGIEIVQRAMLMAMEPIWESDFHRASYGFRPARSVHHAIRTVKLQLQDGGEQSVAGRWVIEGDLASYFDTVHHRLLMKGIRKRIADQRFLALLWRLSRRAVLIATCLCRQAKGFHKAASSRRCYPTSCCMSSMCGWRRTT
jgi:RNA-directed DNA polymerase